MKIKWNPFSEPEFPLLLQKRIKMRSVFTLFALIIFQLTYSQVPMNWTRNEVNPGEDFTLTPDETFYTEGTKSCHAVINSGAVPYLISDVYYVNPGSTYEFSLDVFDNDTAGQVKVYADFYDAYGFDIFGKPPVFSADSSEWQTIVWSGSVPDQAVVGYVLIKYYCQPDLYHFTVPSDIWIDNVQFLQDGTGNLLINGGFEAWDLGVDEVKGYEDLFSLYPNPASNMISFDLPEKADILEIYNCTGQELIHKEIQGKKKLQLDIHNFQKGMYIAVSVLEDGSRIERKWIRL